MTKGAFTKRIKAHHGYRNSSTYTFVEKSMAMISWGNLLKLAHGHMVLGRGEESHSGQSSDEPGKRDMEPAHGV